MMTILEHPTTKALIKAEGLDDVVWEISEQNNYALTSVRVGDFSRYRLIRFESGTYIEDYEQRTAKLYRDNGVVELTIP